MRRNTNYNRRNDRETQSQANNKNNNNNSNENHENPIIIKKTLTILGTLGTNLSNQTR